MIAMQFHYVIQGLFVLIGCVVVLAAIFNWNWLFTAKNSQFIVKSAGRKQARLFYGIVGCLMIATGIFFFLSVRGLA